MSKWKVFKRDWAPATGKHWQVLDDEMQCDKVFATFHEAVMYADRIARTVDVVLPRVPYGFTQVNHGLDSCVVEYSESKGCVTVLGFGDRVDIPYSQLDGVARMLLSVSHVQQCDLMRLVSAVF